MRTTLIFVLILLTSSLFGQRLSKRNKQAERLYISSADSFLILTFGKERFDSYFKFETIYAFARKGNLQYFPPNISDTALTNIITDYTLTVPEIAYYNHLSLEFDKKIGKRFLRQVEEIPNYLLNKLSVDLLDTTAIKEIMANNGIKNEIKCDINCTFSSDYQCFIFTIEEMVTPYSEKCGCYTVNRFEIDAITGEILNVKKNAKIFFIDG